jgi:hypothetical protein
VTWNEQEEDRLEGLQIAKLRGKGAPKKKRTADGEFGLSLASLRGHIVADGTSLTNIHGEQRARRARRKRGSLRSRSCYNTCKYTHPGVFGGKYRGLTESHCGCKAQFNAVFHLLITISALPICAAALPALLRFSYLLPSLSQLPPLAYPYPQIGSTVARALEESHLVLKESLVP